MDVRAFYRSSKAWYAKSLGEHEPEIMFGIYDDHGEGCVAEMSMRWHQLGENLVPRLECFDDGWSVLATFGDLLAELAKRDGKNITEAEFADILLKLGFKDQTQYTNPEGQPAVCPQCGQPIPEPRP